MVIGVIALLIAITVPALARSRERARTLLCQTNLKQIGTCLLMYANAHKGVLPYENKDPAHPERTCWFFAIDPYLSRSKADKTVKTCPTVLLDDPRRNEGYRMNSKLAEAPKDETDPEKMKLFRPYRKVDTLDRPGATVVLFDADVGGSSTSYKGRWRHKDAPAGDDVNYRHNMNANLLFADWHVEGIHKNVLAAKSLKNSPIIWQPPDVGIWDPMGGDSP